MARRYDNRTTIFSPDGRLYQVEYAMEAISHAGTCLGLLASDGIVLAAEKKVTSKLLSQDDYNEKIYTLNANTICSVAGITADANTLIQYGRKSALLYKFKYGEEIPVEQLVQRLCDLKQGYTQFGGLRPYGVSFLYAGHDPFHGFQLYHSDPSGNYSGWKATCIGSNNSSAQSILKQEYKLGNEEGESMSLRDCIRLALKVMSKTMDSSKLNSEKLEFATVSMGSKGEPELKIFTNKDIEEILEEFKDVFTAQDEQKT
eukprot:TRINITY_DN49238_c0_g1_i1.p1 TRINITY_DN49238_c0_g1~~TRINITY_DN49238_c0_g1_i1.p1  ORF type:complete len:259 (-),score=-1.00 TRINITY_DN49238_c0_g1_i1:56-832(-)